MNEFKSTILGETIGGIISILGLLYKDDALRYFRYIKAYFMLWFVLIRFLVKTAAFLLSPNIIVKLDTEPTYING